MLVSQMETHVLIPAAGKGRRMGADCNKQFLKIAGKPVIVRTVETCRAFTSSLPEGCVSGIHLICAPDEIEDMKALMAEHGLADAVTSYVAGGLTRQESVYRGLLALEKTGADPEKTLIMVHDGARCLASPALFARCRDTAALYGASCPGIPVKDTLRRALELSGQVPTLHETVPRQMLYRMQTPQCFMFQTLLNANRLALSKAEKGEISAASLTDDVSIVQLAGVSVRLVEGEAGNLKITSPEDIKLAEALAAVEKNSVPANNDKRPVH